MTKENCEWHPSRAMVWDGIGWVCPSCREGYPAETDADDQE